MKIKVCGMRDANNIRQLIPEIIHSELFNKIRKVGVFVNADIDFILKKIEEFNLNAVQLHGKETPQYLIELRIKSLNLEIWKVFSVDDTFDFNETKGYEALADKFLFDTKTPLHGGSGQKFDWEILKNYNGQTPFFLSGGISAADTKGVKSIRHPQFFGLDLNSKFEISPAFKDVEMLRKFISNLQF